MNDLPYDIIKLIGSYIKEDIDIISLFRSNKLLYSYYKKHYQRLQCVKLKQLKTIGNPSFTFNSNDPDERSIILGVFSPINPKLRRINFTFSRSNYSTVYDKNNLFICYHKSRKTYIVTSECKELGGFHNNYCKKHNH
jgi:hypothetical protein